MKALVACAAALLGTGGATVLYLGSPHQQLMQRPLNKRIALAAGGFAIALSQILLLTLAGPATAVFILCVLLMLLWSVPPLALGYLRRNRKTRR